MKTVAITGCNGFIGHKLTQFLISKKVFVIGLDISEPSISDSDFFTYLKLDFSMDLVSELAKYNIDVLYHFAWCGVSSLDKDDYQKQFENFGITFRVLQLVKEAEIKKIIIPGSMSEFSKSSTPVTGNEEDSPSDLYAATKVALRKIAFQFCEKNKIDMNWLLITSVYSTDRQDANLITYAINELSHNRTIKTTPLEQKWDYLSVEDLINAVYLIGEKGKAGEIYPIGSGDVHSLYFFVNYLAKKMKKKHLLRIGALPYKNGFIDNSVPDIRKLLDLGFSCTTSFISYLDTILGNL